MSSDYVREWEFKTACSHGIQSAAKIERPKSMWREGTVVILARGLHLAYNDLLAHGGMYNNQLRLCLLIRLLLRALFH